MLEGQETATAYCPEYYPLIQAARYHNVPPWELLDQPYYWTDKALVCISAENKAQKQIQDRQEARNR